MSAQGTQWRTKKLKDLPIEFIDGDRSHRYPKRDEFQSSGILFLNTTNILDNRLDFSDANYISAEKFASLHKGKLRPLDLVMTTRGSVGKVALFNSPRFRTGFINAQMLIVRPDGQEIDQRFLYYVLIGSDFQSQARNYASGSAQPQLPIRDLVEIAVTLPPASTQRKIADILSAYDDLIENNARRINILEEMAQTIYREWFVHFRFPGHEDVEMVETELGLVPNGWKAVSFSDLMESYMGGDWGSESQTDREEARVSIIRGTDFKDVKNGGNLRTPVRFISANSLAKRKLTDGDIIVENSVNASSRSVGSSLLVTRGILRRLDNNAICASFCKNFRLKDTSLAPLIYLHMTHLFSEGRMTFYQHVATNGIGNFQAQRFMKTEVIFLPHNETLLAKLIDVLAPLTTAIYADQISMLRETRDLLLPKLISGEVSV